MNESEETEEIKTFYAYLLQEQQALPICKAISVGRPGDVSYTTPLPHPTTPNFNSFWMNKKVPNLELSFSCATCNDPNQPAHLCS